MCVKSKHVLPVARSRICLWTEESQKGNISNNFMSLFIYLGSRCSRLSPPRVLVLLHLWEMSLLCHIGTCLPAAFRRCKPTARHLSCHFCFLPSCCQLSHFQILHHLFKICLYHTFPHSSALIFTFSPAFTKSPSGPASRRQTWTVVTHQKRNCLKKENLFTCYIFCLKLINKSIYRWLN